MWTKVIELLEGAGRVVLTTHVGSDGDGIGSELALGRTLAGAGKTVSILNPTRTQDRYRFLFEDGEIVDYDASQDAVVAAADVIVVLDINRWDRLGDLSDLVRRSNAVKLCVDHHPAPEYFGAYDVSDPTASATGVLVAELIQSWVGRLSDDTLSPLYVAIMTDTGSFRFANTDSRAMRIAADLVERGVRPDELYRRVYESSSRGRMLLLGNVLSSLEYELGGRLVTFTITNALLAECGVDREEAEGFTDVIRAVEGSLVVLSFVENDDGSAKISLRSKGRVLDVGLIAREFGGGGHANASGILHPSPLVEAREDVLRVIRERLSNTTVGS